MNRALTKYRENEALIRNDGVYVISGIFCKANACVCGKNAFPSRVAARKSLICKRPGNLVDKPLVCQRSVMKRTLFLFLLCCLLPLGARAEGLWLDGAHAYEGMERSYDMGYSPEEVGNALRVVLPVLSDEAVGELTAELVYEEPASAPFAMGYAAQAQRERYSFDGETVEAWVFSFRVPLYRDRLNGEYPFSIAVRGVDAAGNALEARFPLEAVITGGQENGEVPQLLLMDFRAGDGAWIEAGEEATLSLTLANQSATRAVENIAIVFAESTGGLLPARSDTVRVSRLAAGESALVEIPIRAAMDAEPRAHSVEIRAQGAYGAGKDTSVAEKFTVDVRQSVRFAHSEAALPVRVTQGDVSSFTITLMNMGKSPLSNALLTFDVPGLASGGSVLAGDLAPGESKDATANFRVSSDGALAGPVSGTVTLSYEDAYGEYYETILPLSTTIEKKVPLAAASADEEEEAAPFPYLPWSLFAAALIALIVLQTLARRRIRALEERGL